MTILSVAYPFLPVSEDSAGGAEQILFLVERGLVDAGHESIVIAAEGSSVCGQLVPTPQPGTEITDDIRRSAQRVHREAIETVLERYSVDLIHFHGLDFHEYLPKRHTAMLATLHLPLQWYPECVFGRSDITLNLVSHSQAASHPAAAGRPLICNGIDVSRYYRSERNGQFGLVLARVCPEKGIDVALRVAHRRDLPLLIAGPIYPFETHQRYFTEQVEPLLDRKRRYIGAVGLEAKVDLLSKAKCLLAPSLVAETSSLVAMEAICSGTPVVAYRSGVCRKRLNTALPGSSWIPRMR